MRVNISLAAWPGLQHEHAAALAIGASRAGHLKEPCFGEIACEHVQLVPQSGGVLTEQLAAELKAAYPETKLRLHANVRMLPHHRFADLSGFTVNRDWFEQAARVSRVLDAPTYSAHAGRRAEATVAQMLDNARRCADLFGVPVAIEGHYPTPHGEYLIADWEEYRTLLDSGVPYALDLSHLNIVAHQTKHHEAGLVAELLACERLLELHVSSNEGRGDQHQICTQPCWWHALLHHTHAGAVVFTEGNHRPKMQPTREG